VFAPAQLRATYRLQLTPEFGFASASELVPYLRDLGVSHLYLSPSLQARPGSQHGYDVLDPTRLSDDLGGRDQFRALTEAVHEAGMGVVLDIVPNHMAADEANRYWSDPELRRRYFDVDPVTGEPRRFFDISDLAGVRQEDPAVFEDTHGLVLALVAEGLVDGLRIDHPDGLADPASYLVRLRERGVPRVWVEKILESRERLRDWPVSGTVGYEFLNDVCALFVDPAGEPRMTSLWERVSGDRRSFECVAHDAKLEQVQSTFTPELERLERELAANGGGGIQREELTRALSGLPIYRTYVEPVTGVVSDEDRRAVDEAGMASELAQMLLLEREAPASFVTRFQQTTPPIMAKGVEDTAFYRYGRLLALNEVGGDPGRFSIEVEDFHAACLERARRFPESLLTTQTHDTKRSADVRARLTALSAMAEEWEQLVDEFMELSERHREGGAPDDVERYFLLQTLVGAWPIELERVQEYMEKALREAKRNTNWIDQNQEWEEAVKRFCAALYGDRAFLEQFLPFVRRVASAGERAVLGQVVLKLTVPGIPDLYQGDELPFRALVDPDNRRPVDWGWCQAMLARLMGGSPAVHETRKLFLILRLLTLRTRRPRALSTGAYEPIEAGPRACVFTRGDEVLVAVATRDGAAEDTFAAPQGRWRDVLRGEQRTFSARQRLGDVLGEHGFTVLERLSRPN
jgi:(1->4)-alpha-D-glucan 1-alpha-D-glucosylmutase